MRLTQIKLAGFKSFVDPTTIGTPGKLVGIVGPNGCGKSNVIDAVRWVLGESKASALRGESMQDVIFNGAGERKPVGRASVELNFDNDLGRIGGEWGRYAQIAIKRVLTRDGDSSYYINNIPVRRRDIHDLFLGTGLGPRAYAIIEQGMISRVIEAKPEELRVFLEEAAGVSKYKERRRETEGRLSDSRENLARVEDIRIELGHQLERLATQARVATEYRELEARLARSQQLLWFARQQEAVRNREKCSAEIGTLTLALEAAQAEVRAAEARLEALRAEHYAGGDALHAAQAAFYAANAEVTRFEQQLAFARDNENRIAQQAARLAESLAALAAQEEALRGESHAGDAAIAAAVDLRQRTAADEATAGAALPASDRAVSETTRLLGEAQARVTQGEQGVRVAETQRDSVARGHEQLAQRRSRLVAELAALAAPMDDPVTAVASQLEQEVAELADKQAALAALQAIVQQLQERQRHESTAWQAASQRLADREARAEALAAMQARIGHGEDIDAWLASHQLAGARQLWRVLDVDAGWEDALEAALRDWMKALELASLGDTLAWSGDGVRLPRRLSAYTPADAPHAAAAGADSLLAKVVLKDGRLARLLADGLHGVRCRDDLSTALAERAMLGPGESFVTPHGHLVTAQGVAFFAPDSELHGVLARQRELDQLAGALVGARADAAAARAGLEALEGDLKARQTDYHADSLALASQQRRTHDLELELVQLRQSVAAAAARRAQLSADETETGAQVAVEHGRLAALHAEIADRQAHLHDERAQVDALRHARNEAEVELARAREGVRSAERAAQEAGFAERSARERSAELARRSAALAAQQAEQQALHRQLAGERQSIDWAPVEAALQARLADRAQAEQALAAARDHVEALGSALRLADEARLVAEHGLDPARVRIQEMQLKEQAAMLAEQQFAEQLAQVHADLEVLPDAFKSWGSVRTLPGEIDRVGKAIAELGPVNLAALDELAQAQERKAYLDRQAADLTEAMTTLETAIRQIDRESRELLQQTFNVVNDNFARLFPALFGGGQARLLLTGEEILDSGVQVVAQPPGKRNASIHLLSGGEKAMTAIALVFALFEINPAPFCLLDEVDAPLDDPNTERFCRMVTQMSAGTQFLFISHNKITMEMASQLIGITMPEPGVSRVVAVDIAEALELAANAPVAAAAD